MSEGPLSLFELTSSDNKQDNVVTTVVASSACVSRLAVTLPSLYSFLDAPHDVLTGVSSKPQRKREEHSGLPVPSQDERRAKFQ